MHMWSRGRHNIQHEAVVNGLKKKHGDAVQEMNEQIDALQKMKTKIEHCIAEKDEEFAMFSTKNKLRFLTQFI